MRSLFSSVESRNKFAEAVLNIVAKAPADTRVKNPTEATRREGEESVSYIKQELRYDGWRIPGNDSDFRDMIREAGFTIREVSTGRTSKAYVTL